MTAAPMEYFDPPPLRYMGAKWQLAKWVTGQFPPHKIYVEPYCGSAAIFFRKQRTEVEVLNDLNKDLVHFFKVLRENPDALINAIELTPFSLDEYQESWEACDEPVERARRFYIRCWQSFSADTVTKSGWRRSTSLTRNTTTTQDWKRLDGLKKAVDLLRCAQIDNLPALDCIRRYDSPDTVFYIDPPYVHATRKSLRHKYIHEMNDADHQLLAQTVSQIEGMAIISGYDSELYRQLYAGWRVETKSNTTNGNSTATEYLWISPNVDRRWAEIQPGLFSEER